MRLILKFVKMVVFVYLFVGLRRASTAVLTLQRLTDNYRRMARGIITSYESLDVRLEIVFFYLGASLICLLSSLDIGVV